MSDFSSNIDFDDVEKLKSLPNGVRYVTKTSNLPSDITSNFGWVIKLSRSIFKCFLYISNHITLIKLFKTFYNTLSEWRYINAIPTDTGWISLKLINGVTTNTASDLYIPASYRVKSNKYTKTFKLLEH